MNEELYMEDIEVCGECGARVRFDVPDNDDFRNGKIGRCKCPECGHIQVPCDICEGCNIGDEVSCTSCPWKNAEFVEAKDKPKAKKKFAVDVFFTLARSYEVEASSREVAEAIVRQRIERGDITFRDGFEQTDDYEYRCSGEANEDGDIEYF